MADPASKENFIKDTIHYYEEGNVIFIVEDHTFRVVKSLLGRRSAVMNDMFSLASPDNQATSQMLIDGVPAITLYDSPDDFRLLLDFIFPQKTPNPISSPLSLIQLVNISRKHEVEDVVLWAVEELTAILPRSEYSLEQLEVYEDPAIAIAVYQSTCVELLEFVSLACYALVTLEWADAAHYMEYLKTEDFYKFTVWSKALQIEVMKCPDVIHLRKDCPYYDSDCNMGKWNAWGEDSDLVTRWSAILLHPLEELNFRAMECTPSLCHECLADLNTEALAYRGELVERLKFIFNFNVSDSQWM